MLRLWYGLMAKSKSSGRWLREHFNDEFVKKAQKEGYRSRATYKLLEIQQKDKIFRPGDVVVDLGAAPGGWAQFAVKQVGRKGRVYALDLLAIDPIEGVDIIQGDFSEECAYQSLMACLVGQQVDLVISDMAPNISGMRSVDQPKMVYLGELAVAFAEQVLKTRGIFLAKMFQGEGVEELYQVLRQRFSQVITRKPKASRARSREVYILAKGYKL